MQQIVLVAVDANSKVKHISQQIHNVRADAKSMNLN